MNQRYFIVGITAVAALWLYIDRVCFSTLADPIKIDLLIPDAPEPPPEARYTSDQRAAVVQQAEAVGLSLNEGQVVDAETAAAKKRWADNRMSYVLGAFFFTYALFQIPIGAMADRFGARAVLAVSIAAWSLVTFATGFAQSFAALLAIRLLLGVTESGAYPAAAGLVKSWARPEERGRFSSVVALGGRIGGALAPWLTTALTALLVGVPLTFVAFANPSGVNWRGVLVIYGLCGLSVAVMFWLFVRNRPQNSGSEAPQTPENLEVSSPRAPVPFVRQLGALARSRNMWFFGTMQFGVNLGWAFLVTLFPTYLNEAFDVPLERRGPMQSMVLTIGCFGMFFGGMFTDLVRAKLGPKLGRRVPLAVALSGCSIALLLVPTFANVWLVIVALGLMAFLVDLHNPTIWSFAQDVGGRNVGAALGWGNMWGNLGAALSPILLQAIKSSAGWDVVFVVGGLAFAAAAACGLMLDATKPVNAD